MAKRIVVVGSINLDLVGTTQRIPIAGETVAGLSFQTFPGGKGANQAVAAARLGGSVSMLGKLGTDAFGAHLRDSLAESRVNTDGIEVVHGSSGIALITTDAKGENAITVVAGANAHLSPADLDEHSGVIRGAGILLTQLEIPLETVEHLAAIAIRERIPLVMDPAPARPLPSSLLKCVDWLTPNETETCFLLGCAPSELHNEALGYAANALLGYRRSAALRRRLCRPDGATDAGSSRSTTFRTPVASTGRDLDDPADRRPRRPAPGAARSRAAPADARPCKCADPKRACDGGSRET